jgi:hypothetical protein
LPSIIIIGQTNHSALVVISVNGQEVSHLNSTGNSDFSALVPLMLGDNTITVTASNGADVVTGNFRIVRLEVPTTSTEPFETWPYITAGFLLGVALLAAVYDMRKKIQEDHDK